MPDQPYHHGDLRRTLLEAAAASIESDGVDALSLRQLAREAGVSHAAPSRHFRDKQALLDALAEDGFRRMAATLEQAATIETKTQEGARAAFDAISRAYVEFALAQPTLLAMMFGLKHAPDAKQELIRAGHASMEITLRLVVEAQSIGAIAPGDPQRIALVAFATLHGIATLASGDLLDGVPSDDLLAEASDLLWRGMRTKLLAGPELTP